MEPMLFRLAEKLKKAAGATAQEVCAGDLAEPLDCWTGEYFMRFIEGLRQVTGDEHMGLGVEPWPLGASDFVVAVGARCEILRDAIDMTIRFWTMTTGNIAISLEENGKEAIISLKQAPSPRDPEAALSDWTMISLYTTLQWLIRSDLALDRAELAHPLDASYSAYQTMFGGECVFNAEACRLVFSRKYLDRPILRNAEEAGRLAKRKGGGFSRQALLFRSWRQKASNAVLAALKRGAAPPTLDELALEFGLSSQTLRRRLQDEGVSYRFVKAAARGHMAMQVLANDKGTVEAASAAAGFAESNALSRALKRARGVNAGELRESVRRWRTKPASSD